MVDGRHTDVVSIPIQWMFKSSLDNHKARIREQRTPSLMIWPICSLLTLRFSKRLCSNPREPRQQ